MLEIDWLLACNTEDLAISFFDASGLPNLRGDANFHTAILWRSSRNSSFNICPGCSTVHAYNTKKTFRVSSTGQVTNEKYVKQLFGVLDVHFGFVGHGLSCYCFILSRLKSNALVFPFYLYDHDSCWRRRL
jgi:hypothetical protein